MSNDKETPKIIVEHKKFKNVFPQDNVQKAYEKQLSANLLKTHNYFENTQRISMLSTMKVEWSERDPTTRWFIEIEDTTKP